MKLIKELTSAFVVLDLSCRAHVSLIRTQYLTGLRIREYEIILKVSTVSNEKTLNKVITFEFYCRILLAKLTESLCCVFTGND